METRAYRKVRIFVASPGDVSDERGRLARMVATMNQSGGVAEHLGLTLELLRWETHAVPDIGRPQQVVFDSLNPDDWDIFVGILWMRFGTPTGKKDPATGEDFQSGTEEEFKAALSRRRTAGDGWPKVLFYRRVPSDENRIDPVQYGRVQGFFKQFEADGAHPGLIQKYTETEEFERKVREHLERCILEYTKMQGRDSDVRPDSPVSRRANRTVSATGGSVAIDGNVTNSTIVTGNGNKVGGAGSVVAGTIEGDVRTRNRK